MGRWSSSEFPDELALLPAQAHSRLPRMRSMLRDRWDESALGSFGKLLAYA